MLRFDVFNLLKEKIVSVRLILELISFTNLFNVGWGKINLF